MKNRFLLAVLLASLAAGIWLLWFEDNPGVNPAKTGTAEHTPQVETRTPRRLFEPRERDPVAKISARDPASTTEQAPANRSATAGVEASTSRSLKTTSAGRGAEDFPDDEDPEELEELVIGGLVQDEEGNPLPDFEVLAERIDNSDNTSVAADAAVAVERSVFSDIDGAFLFRDLEDGDYRLRIAPVEGIAPAEARVRVGTLNVILVVVMLRDILVHGTVNSTGGKPIEGVGVIASPANRRTTTGAGGEYQLYISRQGADVRHTIRFQHERFREEQVVVDPADLDTPSGDYQLDVSMEPLKRRTTVAGRLTDAEGSPVVGMTIDLLTPQMRTWSRAQSDGSGNFLFEEVEPGKDHQLRIRPVSLYKNKDINPLVVPAGGLKLDIVLESLDQGELSGWMIDLDGHPVPGFSLKLVSTVATTHSVSVMSDPRGFFFVKDFPVGDAHFRSNSYPNLTVQGLRVSAEPEDPVTVILDTGRYVLEGWVKDGSGEPVAASSITLGFEFTDSGLWSTSTRKTTADQSGYFVFTGLGPGMHTLQVTAQEFRNSVRTIDVGVDSLEIVVELEDEP